MKQVLPGKKFSDSFGGGGGGSTPTPIKNIFVASDYPTIPEANADLRTEYIIAAPSVTDNDPTKTNTGNNYVEGQELRWNGVSNYTVTDQTFWLQVGIYLQMITAYNLNLQDKGLKDATSTSVLKLSSLADPAFNTIKQEITGAVNEVLAAIPSTVKNSSNPSSPDFFVGLEITSDGKTAFSLSVSPNNLRLYLNGMLQPEGIAYTVAGANITWLGTALKKPVPGDDSDELIAIINASAAVGAPISTVFSRTGDVIAAPSDYDASQIDNDSGVAGAFTDDALDQLDTDITNHASAANPHSGSAASGANSDITSLSGLTTALSIAQGGTNSTAALANGKIMASAGGEIVESTVDISSLLATKSYIVRAEANANYGNRRVRNIGATGSYRLNFDVPKNFTGTLTLKVIAYPVSGAGGTGRDVDIIGEYTNTSEASATQYTFSDTTSTYDLGTDDTRIEIDITSLTSNLAPGSEGALLWDNNGIGGSLNIIGVEVTNT